MMITVKGSLVGEWLGHLLTVLGVDGSSLFTASHLTSIAELSIRCQGVELIPKTFIHPIVVISFLYMRTL